MENRIDLDKYCALADTVDAKYLHDRILARSVEKGGTRWDWAERLLRQADNLVLFGIPADQDDIFYVVSKRIAAVPVA